METFLQQMLPPVLPEDCTFTVHSFQDKQRLLANLEKRLRGYSRWLPPSSRIIVLIDRDNSDCYTLKRTLESAAANANLRSRSAAGANDWQVATRVVIEELEAWYFGDWEAVTAAYPRVSITIPHKARYRNPDAIMGGTWEAFERVMKRSGYFRQGLRKVEAARAIAKFSNPQRNTSHSFSVFRDAVTEATAPSI